MNISMLLAEIYNIRAIADSHKKHCSENCNVSLTMLKNTATRMRNQLVKESEYLLADEQLKGWPS